MDRVFIVGAGLYGLITAKTYLQVAGTYDNEGKCDDTGHFTDDIPPCFFGPKQTVKESPGCNLLVLDAASDIGGTWAEKRLYPNLLSQNSYGLYEFSDLPLSDVVPAEEGSDVGTQFIAGWKINKYLHAWVTKWKLRRHIKLSFKVDSIQRLESKEWKITVRRTTDPDDVFSLICDKLILATGLTSIPNVPVISPEPQTTVGTPELVIHAKDVGDWARAHLGYRPLPCETKSPPEVPVSTNLRSVAIYGGAKSSFDLVHFFATLHRNDKAMHLETAPETPVQVHWIIRENGTGPAWMAPPTSALPNGDVVASDKAGSSRLLHYFAPCSYQIPKRLSRNGSKGDRPFGFHLEGSWLTRLFHGTPLGRWWIRWFWDSVDRSLVDLAQYEKDTKMQLLRPNESVISCGSSTGIANQPDLWEIIRSPQVKVHRSSISTICAPNASDKGSGAKVTISLADGSCIEGVELVVHATGYKPIVPIKFEPPSFRLSLGLSALVNTSSEMNSDYEKVDSSGSIKIPADDATKSHMQHWEALDHDIEPRVRQTLNATGCVPLDDSKPSSAGEGELLPYRLFRRMVSPKLVAEGDRSFATVGVVLTAISAVVAEVQALWVTAFLTGGFGQPHEGPRMTGSGHSNPLDLDALSQTAMERTVSEDVVVGSLTGSSLEVYAIHVSAQFLLSIHCRP